MSEEPEEIIVVPLWRVCLPLAKLWGVLCLLAFWAGVVRGLS